jgi:hypothetical protein
MPADDLVLNVRQIAGYPPVTSAPTSAALLLQLAGLGSPYASISPADLVGTALSTGGDMAIGGSLSALSVSGGSAQFSNGAFGMLTAQKACIVNFAANVGTIGGVPIATTLDVAASVTSFNTRTGPITLWLEDILCAGGAPIFSPRFLGNPRAMTPCPESNSTRLATTAYVTTALTNVTLDFAPLESPNFTGYPTAPTAATGASDGQIATTAFVMNAVADSVTGVASFNGRTGLVVLTGADLTSAGGALLAGPTFTGVPAAPTAAPATNTTQLATCAFVAAAIAAIGAGVASFNTRVGAVTLTSADIAAVGVSSFNGRVGDVFLIGNDVSAAGGALLASPAFTGVPTAPTAIPATNTTQLATTAFVQAAVSAATSGVQSFNGRAGVVVLTAADLTGAGGALSASPTFTGVPAAPTAAPATSTTQLATTAFVQAAVAAGTAGVASFNSRTGAVTLIANDLSAAGGALLASPIFTGTPQAPTATPGTNTAQLATTAFVMAGASTTTPLMDGTAAVGNATTWARANHVHPTDTSRAAQASLANYLPLAGGTMTGTLNGTSASFTGSISGASFAASGQVSGLSGFINGPLSVQGPLTVPVGDSSISANGTGSYVTVNGAVDVANGANLILSGGGRGDLSIEFDWAGGNMGAFDTASNFTVNAGAAKPGGGAWGATSDARIKDVLDEYTLGLAEVVQLNPVVYTYKGNDTPTANGTSIHRTVAEARTEFVGLVAQEVEPVFPGMVTKANGWIDGVSVTDLRSLNTGELVFALVNAVKQLAARVATLEAAA